MLLAGTDADEKRLIVLNVLIAVMPAEPVKFIAPVGFTFKVVEELAVMVKAPVPVPPKVIF